MYSGTRHGEIANFDEALAQLVEQYPNKGMIQREGGTAAAPDQQGRSGPTITRTQFDALPPASRAKYMNEGGRIGDARNAAQGAPAAAQQSSAKAITRAQFDSMSPANRMTHARVGGTVVD
jgi:hypothetical protein